MNHDWNFEQPEEEECVICGKVHCDCGENDWEVYDD